MQILIVDDIESHRKLLKKDLTKLGVDPKLMLDATNKEEFLSVLEKDKPEIVFLDIDLGNDFAFDILDKIPSKLFELIFTTAHSQYAIDSYKYGATDYLTKPISINRLQIALERAQNTIKERIKNKRNEALLFNVSDFPKFERRIILPELKQIHNKRINEILYIESSNSTCTFYFQDGNKITVSKNLKYYEDQLTDINFCRVHNSYIVNLFFVETYIHAEDALRLVNKKTIQVARARKEIFFNALFQLGIK